MKNKILALVLMVAGSTYLLAGDEITKTNLPVTITIQVVTNVVEGNNQRGCSTCEMLRKAAESGTIPAIYHPWHNADVWREADEKWTITNTVKRVTMTLEWQGKTLTHTNEEVLNSKTNRWKLHAEWQEVTP
jgi:hypothetical protein